MRPEHLPAPPRIIGDLLLNHSEAASLLGKATHWQSMAVWSAATTRRKLAAAQAARLAYEQLGHLLEPRGRHPVNFAAGLLLLLVLGVGLVMLDLIELDGLRSVLAALAATAVWLTGAWLAAIAARRRSWTVVTVLVGAGALLAAMLVVLHGVSPHPAWPAVDRRTVFGALAGSFIMVLTAGGAVLMVRLEPASLLVARQRWHRAQAAYEAAVEVEQADAQAAAITRDAWLGLVQARVTAIAAGEDDLIQATVAVAAALVGNGRARLRSAD